MTTQTSLFIHNQFKHTSLERVTVKHFYRVTARKKKQKNKNKTTFQYQVNNTKMVTHKHGRSRTTGILDGHEWASENETLGGVAGALWAAAGHLRSTTEGGGRWTEPMRSLRVLYGSTTSPITLGQGQRPNGHASKSVRITNAATWLWIKAL